MRNKAIDIMKGILTIMMISCHLLYQTVQNPGLFNEYVNLTTFSGFLFCFGFVAYVAYFQKYDIPPVKKLIMGGGENSLCLLRFSIYADFYAYKRLLV